MNPERVLAIVVAFNGGATLGRCIQALFATTYRAMDVLVVDNASGDGSVDELARARHVEVLSLPSNRGFAGAVNAGISHAKATRSRRLPAIYALVNQDCFPSVGWLGPLVTTLLADRSVGVVGSRLFDADGTTLQHAGGIVHANGMTDHHGRGLTGASAGSGGCRDVDYVTGALCAFRADTWDSVGPFDEGYHPVYFEEVDFCFRARARGLRTVYVPESEGVHLEAASSGRGSSVYLRRYHRSRMRFVARHVLKSGSISRAMRAELAWLSRQRRLHDFGPAAAAYLRFPGEWLRARAITGSES